MKTLQAYDWMTKDVRGDVHILDENRIYHRESVVVALCNKSLFRLDATVKEDGQATCEYCLMRQGAKNEQ